MTKVTEEMVERLRALSKVGFGYDIKPADREALTAAVAALSASAKPDEKVINAEKIVRSFVEHHRSWGIQWRIDLNYLMTLCDAVRGGIASAEPGVGVKALEEAYAKGFEASAQGYNGEVHTEYDQDNEWLADRSLAVENIRSALHKESGETLPPIETRNEEAGFVEFINDDRPYIVRDIPAPAAVLLDMETRHVIGYRVYDPGTLPPQKRVGVPLQDEGKT